MLRTLLLTTLIAAATARFSGDMTIRLKPDGSCYSFVIYPHDTAFPEMSCPYHFSCRSNGDGQIASFKTSCRTNGLHDDSTIRVQPHDELQFCCAGFCSCMRTQYLGTVDEGAGKVVSFGFDDDQAYNC